MKRKIIEINEELCTGCGECVPDCAEGSLQIIDGKAKLVEDKLCDGSVPVSALALQGPCRLLSGMLMPLTKMRWRNF